MKLLAIMKKEFVRFFRDPRLIVTMLLPGIVIYCLYSLMGTVMTGTTKTYEYEVYVCGESQALLLLEEAVTAGGDSVTFTVAEDEEQAKSDVESGKITAFIVFSEGFDTAVDTYEGVVAAYMEIYYRSADEDSVRFYSVYSQVMQAYQRQFAAVPYDCSSESSIMASIMGNILPFIVLALIFSSCMSVTLESIAGEKERGTLATVLVTPVKRWQIALGKVLPLGCIALIGAVSSFLGIMLSLPKLMGLTVGGMISGYGFVSYLLLFLVLLSIVPLIVAAVAAVSTYAKSVKEASAYTGIIMILVLALSLVSSFITDVGAWIVVIPLLNAVVCMQSILFGSYLVWQPLVCVLVNLVYTAGLLFLVGKMLESEKLMFGK